MARRLFEPDLIEVCWECGEGFTEAEKKTKLPAAGTGYWQHRGCHRGVHDGIDQGLIDREDAVARDVLEWPLGELGEAALGSSAPWRSAMAVA